MEDGQRVELQLHGYDGEAPWLPGTVIKARKMWVQLDQSDEVGEMIADENSIKEWRLLTSG